MRCWFARRRRWAVVPGRLDDELPGQGSPLAAADRACCCPARPVFTAIMPPVPGRRRPADLQLCGHHYRAGQAALRAVGAMIYDRSGALIMAGSAAPGAASRQQLAC